ALVPHGGYFVPFVFGLLTWLAIFTRQYSFRKRLRWFIPVIVTSAVLAAIPGSNEQRYFSFWMLNLIFPPLRVSNEIGNCPRYFGRRGLRILLGTEHRRKNYVDIHKRGFREQVEFGRSILACALLGAYQITPSAWVEPIRFAVEHITYMSHHGWGG